MNCGSEDPGTAQRVRHRVLVSKKGVAARRRLEPGECVVRRAHEACVREWCSCADGMRARVSFGLKSWCGQVRAPCGDIQTEKRYK